MTPHQFVLSKRLEQARQLLKTTDLSLSQVALDGAFRARATLPTPSKVTWE
ncbi:hypothetical protein EPA93_14820 [Ktedonosporobacter rubrisoli]|uniref:HTH araC/xylS-type domain-containing protein n=1 Tax=Ktedonosporobacter rubrisoli TaxID=2509675 RepID=A0A4P6JPQ2_KTERU|nr:hypothetical protein EPA93_14820 [Ktedonosporobacter rubrisoli]